MSGPSSGGSPEIIHQGWLTKSPPAKAIFKPRWRRRWFILRAGSYPNQYVLEYFTDQSCRRLKGKINLDECEQLGLSTNLQTSTPAAVQERQKFTFNLRTPQRTYYLAADSGPDMSRWVTCLCHCGLKTADAANDVFKNSVDENNHPAEHEDNHDNLESDVSSPTLSAVSGPYIPISECISGKPIIFNDKEPTYYNTTVFPFPPKVNWETYPRKATESSKGMKTAISSIAPVAPPRPPKTIPSTKSPSVSNDSIINSSPSFKGPAVDRSVKPPESPNSQLALGPTPAQVKNQSDAHRSSRFVSGSTSTLPANFSGRRLNGPVVSPTDKRPVFRNESQDLLGAYLQIDTKSLSEGVSDGKIHGSLKPSNRKLNGLHSDQDSSVEYKLIDHIKTKALNKMIHDREEQLQLRKTPVSKNLN